MQTNYSGKSHAESRAYQLQPKLADPLLIRGSALMRLNLISYLIQKLHVVC